MSYPQAPTRLSYRGLFVTGTDTGVGKTVVCAALMHRFRADVPLRYWKPVQTGIEQDDDAREVTALGVCGGGEVFTRGIRLPRPLSPHLAARLHGVTISIERLVAEIEGETERGAWIIEGAGGVLVPLNAREMMGDFMARLALPVIVAARSGLGTINHTLLTVEALRRRRLDVAGIVMVGDRNDENRTAIEQHGDVEVIGEMPRFAPLTPAALGAWAATAMDPEATLLERLR